MNMALPTYNLPQQLDGPTIPNYYCIVYSSFDELLEEYSYEIVLLDT